MLWFCDKHICFFNDLTLFSSFRLFDCLPIIHTLVSLWWLLIERLVNHLLLYFHIWSPKYDILVLLLLVSALHCNKSFNEDDSVFCMQDLPDLVAVNDADFSNVDAVFCCLPHGTTQVFLCLVLRGKKFGLRFGLSLKPNWIKLISVWKFSVQNQTEFLNNPNRTEPLFEREDRTPNYKPIDKRKRTISKQHIITKNTCSKYFIINKLQKKRSKKKNYSSINYTPSYSFLFFPFLISHYSSITLSLYYIINL